MNIPPLYPIVNYRSGSDHLELFRNLLLVKCGIIQLRAKDIAKKEVALVASEFLKLRDEINPASLVIINDYVDVCSDTNADGVHLGQNDEDPAAARSILGETKIIGISTHSIDQLKSAQSKPVDYLAIGPIFLSKTKSGHAEPLGLAGLTEARNHTDKPLVAIGGINSENADKLYKAGANSLAVIEAIASTNNLEATLLSFSQARNHAL